MNEFLDINQLSEYLNVRRSTLYKWACKGVIPAVRFGSMWRFSRTEVDKWIEMNRVNSFENYKHKTTGSDGIICLSHKARP